MLTIKYKKHEPAPLVNLVEAVKPVERRVIKFKKNTAVPLEQVVEQVKPVERRVIKFKKPTGLEVPVLKEPFTKAMEAFHALCEYYSIRGMKVPQEDIKWYLEELEKEKKDLQVFWDTCPLTWTMMNAVVTGEDENIAYKRGLELERKLPKKLGPMPIYGTPDFWAWFQLKKKIQKEAEDKIIAEGGTLPPPKIKKPRKPKST